MSESPLGIEYLVLNTNDLKGTDDLYPYWEYIRINWDHSDTDILRRIIREEIAKYVTETQERTANG